MVSHGKDVDIYVKKVQNKNVTWYSIQPVQTQRESPIPDSNSAQPPTLKRSDLGNCLTYSNDSSQWIKVLHRKMRNKCMPIIGVIQDAPLQDARKARGRGHVEYDSIMHMGSWDSLEDDNLW